MADEGCRGTDEMDNAGLMLRLGKYGFNGLRHTLEAVCDGDQDVLYATVFSIP